MNPARGSKIIQGKGRQQRRYSNQALMIDILW